MAISQMAKVLIVSHRTEAAKLLEAMQNEGICQILNAEEAMVSKQWPELNVAADRPRQSEQLLEGLNKAATFLKDYAQIPKGAVSALAPRMVVGQQMYEDAVADEKLLEIATQAQQVETTIEQLKTEIENLQGVLTHLEPWQGLDTPVEQIGQLETTICMPGLLPSQYVGEIKEKLAELDSFLETVGESGSNLACIVICLKGQAVDVQKLLRSVDFESVSFEPMVGTVAELVEQNREKLNQTHSQLESQYEQAKSLAENLLGLQILCDHYGNLLSQQQSRSDSPATEHTVLFEGWVKKRDYKRLEKVVSGFSASSLSKMELAQGEEGPVEIDNNKAVEPFEAITRLYGMPNPVSLDPTVFLAPFFALFFGLCLTDAGYGIVLVAILWYFLKKLQGDKRMIWMMMVCSVLTIAAGIITGGWFGDAVQNFLPGADNFRKSLMLFDPMKEPMTFFAISLALGYIQIMFGIVIALFHCIRRKDYTSAVCNQLTWLVMLNSLIMFGLCKGGIMPSGLSVVFAITSIVPALTILLFSEREGAWSGRVGMGVFNLFCTVFYVGDVLSYVRIMALGMVSAGFGMAINIIVLLVSDIPYIGWLLGIVMFVGGHLFNLALSVLGSFVHSMRLQFVEFFPKFFEGGGKEFAPLKKEYKYIQVD